MRIMHLLYLVIEGETNYVDGDYFFYEQAEELFSYALIVLHQDAMRTRCRTSMAIPILLHFSKQPPARLGSPYMSTRT